MSARSACAETVGLADLDAFDYALPAERIAQQALPERDASKLMSIRRGTPDAPHVLIAAARYLAAHAPTVRAQGQTYQIAQRLHRGEQLYEET